MIAYGTRRFSGGKDLALVRGGKAPALRVDFDDGAPLIFSQGAVGKTGGENLVGADAGVAR